MREALSRLTALADRAPATFTSEVVAAAVQLVVSAGVTSLLGPLRHLARRRAEFRAGVLSAALSALRTGPVVDAGRCIADLTDLLDGVSLDRATIRSLVVLAGEPEDTLVAALGRQQGGAPGSRRASRCC